MNKKTFDTINQIRAELPKILEEYGNNTAISRAALVNPVLALETIGYTLSESLKKEVEYYVRFGEKKKDKLLNLEKKIYSMVGSEFKVSDNESVRKHLKPLLGDKIEILSNTSKRISYRFSLNPSNSKQTFSKKYSDALVKLKNEHAVVPLLIEAREIEASRGKLGSGEIFSKLLESNNIEGFKLNSVKFKLQGE